MWKQFFGKLSRNFHLCADIFNEYRNARTATGGRLRVAARGRFPNCPVSVRPLQAKEGLPIFAFL
jgi:hypothetical protein